MKTRWWIVVLSVLGALVLIVAGAFVTPPAHEVHTPGGAPLNAKWVVSDKFAGSNIQPIPPSQSLEVVRCEFWRLSHPQTSACPDGSTLASLYFTNLTQSPKTLYLPWRGCANSWTSWEGVNINVEYLAVSRTVLIHCYTAEALVSLPRPRMMGVEALPPPTLLLVPTDSFSVGNISVEEDDRLERLLGDQSTQFQLAIATIS